jgi:hypothetical protein
LVVASRALAAKELQALPALFAVLDDDKDGLISNKTLKHYLTNIGDRMAVSEVRILVYNDPFRVSVRPRGELCLKLIAISPISSASLRWRMTNSDGTGRRAVPVQGRRRDD